MIDWLKHFERFEGRVNHFYLDGAGLPTIGVGCRVWDPTELRMRRKSTSIGACRADVMADYDAVRMLPAGKPAAYYDKVCLLYLADEDIDALFSMRVAPFIDAAAVLPSGSPDEARLVMADMAYTLGVDGLRHKFPKFRDAMTRGDWLAAAMECRRDGVQPARNEWAKEVLCQIGR